MTMFPSICGVVRNPYVEFYKRHESLSKDVLIKKLYRLAVRNSKLQEEINDQSWREAARNGRLQDGR